MAGGEDVVIALDTELAWHPATFEQAVIAAASLYFHASRRQMNVKLWTAYTGLIQGYQVVLEALAGTTFGEPARNLPNVPLILLTQNSDRLNRLPVGSRWVFWPPEDGSGSIKQDFKGLEIQGDRPLELELQQSV
jgi:uncharacterized protein (DUF58 family)